MAKGYADPEALTASELLRFQKYIALHFIAWERAFGALEDGVFSKKLFEGWDVWFVSVASSDPEFVWPMVRDSQTLHPPFVQHVDAVLGYSRP